MIETICEADECSDDEKLYDTLLTKLNTKTAQARKNRGFNSSQKSLFSPITRENVAIAKTRISKVIEYQTIGQETPVVR